MAERDDRSLMEKLADSALVEAAKKAVRDALWQHKLAGNPVVVWEGGKIVSLQPDETLADDTASTRQPLDKEAPVKSHKDELIERYKQSIDRTLLRENLTRTP